MKKNKYLFLLRNKLLWKHSTRDINSVIYDYNEYFNIGLSNGKSEEEMIIDLGTPEDVALSLEDDRDIMAPIKLLVRMGLGILIVIMSYLNLSYYFNENNIILIGLLFSILSPIGIWLLIGGDLRYLKLENTKTTDSNFRKLVLSVAGFIIIALISTIMILYTANSIITNGILPFGIPNENYNFLFQPMFHLSSIIGLVTIFQIIYYYRRTFVNTLPLLFFVIGTIYSIQTLISKFTFATSPEDLLSSFQLIICLVPFVTGLITTFGSYYLIKYFNKKG